MIYIDRIFIYLEKKFFNMPRHLSICDWDDWYKRAKADRPIAYFVVFTMREFIEQNIIYKYDALERYIKNRYIHKTHIMPTNLEFGGSHRFNKKLINAAFIDLVRYVEKEVKFGEIEKYEEFTYTDEITTFINSLNMITPLKDHMAEEGFAAAEIMELYNWYKTIYMARLEPYKNEFYVEFEKLSNNTFFFDRNDENLSYLFERGCSVAKDMEEAYNKEDEEMLIRLIKIRNELY